MKILYFAWLKEHTGQASEEMQLPDGVETVGGLIPHITKKSAGHKTALKNLDAVRVAVATAAVIVAAVATVEWLLCGRSVQEIARTCQYQPCGAHVRRVWVAAVLQRRWQVWLTEVTSR